MGDIRALAVAAITDAEEAAADAEEAEAREGWADFVAATVAPVVDSGGGEVGPMEGSVVPAEQAAAAAAAEGSRQEDSPRGDTEGRALV